MRHGHCNVMCCFNFLFRRLWHTVLGCRGVPLETASSLRHESMLLLLLLLLLFRILSSYLFISCQAENGALLLARKLPSDRQWCVLKRTRIDARDAARSVRRK